jgi:hypothetical protein
MVDYKNELIRTIAAAVAEARSHGATPDEIRHLIEHLKRQQQAADEASGGERMEVPPDDPPPEAA